MSAASDRESAGGQPGDDVLHLAARHQDGKWAMLYLADKATFSVEHEQAQCGQGQRVLGQSENRRFDAGRTGIEHRREVVSTPDGWEDALLILEAADGPASPTR